MNWKQRTEFWQGLEFGDLVGLASYLSFVVRSEGNVLTRSVMLGGAFIRRLMERQCEGQKLGIWAADNPDSMKSS